MKNTATVQEIINSFQTNYKDTLVTTHHLSFETEKELMGRIYGLERSSRYDNDRKYYIVEDEVRERYYEYKKNVSIQVYYGSATID